MTSSKNRKSLCASQATVNVVLDRIIVGARMDCCVSVFTGVFSCLIAFRFDATGQNVSDTFLNRVGNERMKNAIISCFLNGNTEISHFACRQTQKNE